MLQVLGMVSIHMPGDAVGRTLAAFLAVFLLSSVGVIFTAILVPAPSS
jgi:hypothetical protein